MGLFSKVIEHISQAGAWAGEHPFEAIGLTLVSVAAGGGVGMLAVTILSGTTAIAVGGGLTVGALLYGGNLAVNSHQNKIKLDRERTQNALLAAENAKLLSELAVEKASNSICITALRQNTTALANKDQKIGSLENEILKLSQLAVNKPKSQVLTPINEVVQPNGSEIQEELAPKIKVANESMFKTSGLRHRQKRKLEDPANEAYSEPTDEQNSKPKAG